jgi:hypothetical protein
MAPDTAAFKPFAALSLSPTPVCCVGITKEKRVREGEEGGKRGRYRRGEDRRKGGSEYQ